ncbi:hypothetical protein [Streptomyces sp. NBC_00829]|uniref:hypothetical protein n=1 Tax=Streptomyces sp. NBC_00829 TaxID=2903679 RepID=UPI00386D27FC|nr:hypothetical protein OG293_28170 [Streptomyces sp. NBC_00829]
MRLGKALATGIAEEQPQEHLLSDQHSDQHVERQHVQAREPQTAQQPAAEQPVGAAAAR